MFDVNGYIGQVEELLGISIPPNATQDVIYNLVYDAFAEQMGISGELKTQIDFSSMRPETEEKLQGEERSGFVFIVPMAINKSSKIYADIKAVSYGQNAENIYGAFAEYTLKILACKKDSRSVLNIIVATGIVVAATGGAVAAIIASGGAAAPAIISGVCSGAAAIVSYFASFNDRSFTGLVLNDSNKDAELDYNVGDVYSDCGKVVSLPGNAESRRAYIPKIQENYAYLGLYKVSNSNLLQGAGGVLRFKFANSSPEYIDLMMLSPYARGNVTGITSGGTMYHVSKQFSWMRDADKNTMDMDINGVKGRATIVNMRGSDARGVAWFEFNK